MPDFRTDSFRFGPKGRTATAALLAAVVLAGCTAPGGGGHVSRHEPSYLRLTEERVFAQSLRQRYLELATHAYDRGDMARSDFYSLRALMAVEGKLAQPTDIRTLNLASGTAETAAAAQGRLEKAMQSGVRMGAPDIAARAQAAYDCWLLEAGPDGDAAIAEACRLNTMQALAQLEAASVGARVAHAGAHEVARPQSFTITHDTPSQTIQANGVTIEVIKTTAAPVPAGYAVMHHAPTAMIQAAPHMEMVQVGALPEFEPPDGFEPVPVISEADLIAVAPAAPVIDLGAYEQHAMMPPPPKPAPRGTMAPVYGTDEKPAEMPSVAMATPEMGPEAETADALMAARAAMESDFAVYFGFDSDEVTPEAEDILKDTVGRIRESGAERVTLTGFTDSMGDARYNQLLAMRRAQSVRQYLQRELGTEIAFEILPIGEVEAVRNGGDGVVEALNRRVEIALQ